MHAARAVAVHTLCSLGLALPAGAQSLVDADLSVEPLVSGLSAPTHMAFLGPHDLLVLQKADGRVRRVLNGSLLGPSVLDLPVNSQSERGLLGIAINSETPPGVFLYYTEAAMDGGSPLGNRVYRYDWNPTSGVLENPVLVLDLPVTAGPNHNGGIVALGPPGEGPAVGDGAFLYAVIGDLNRNNQLENFPAGAVPDDTAVVLRVLQDGSPAPGNPFAPYCSVTTTTACADAGDCPGGESCVTEVARYFAYGVRNSFGLTLDPVTGSLWDTENGPGSYDEVNRLAPGTNSGWEQIMGPDARDPQDPSSLFDMPGAGSTYDDPEFSWLSTIAPTAIVFPAGSALGPDYDAVALVGDFNLGQVYAFPLDGARSAFDLTGLAGVADRVADNAAERDQLLFGSGFGGISDLKIGPDGALYVLSIGNGAIYRVTASASAVSAHRPATLAALVLALLAGALWRSARPTG